MSPSSDSSRIRWLTELAEDLPHLPVVERHRPYWSHRGLQSEPPAYELRTTVRRARGLVQELMADHFFSQAFGFSCVDGNGDGGSSPEEELDARLGKAHLWLAADEDFSESDLCDFIEVFHDLSARPTRGWYHTYCDCGFHPSAFHRRSGQALYRWRMNQILDMSGFGLRLADDGEDMGRMIRTAGPGLAELMTDALISSPADDRDDVAHAVALYRSRSATRQDRRSAVVTLAGTLERHRATLKRELLRKDEGALFDIANNFDLRHRNRLQSGDYDDAFLEWIFQLYLATALLLGRLTERERVRESIRHEPV